MTKQSRRVVLSIESMESRSLLSGVHALNIATSDVASPRATDARDRVALLEIRHSDARPGSDPSGARGQHPLGETDGDAHANAIGGKVHSGDSPKVAAKAQPSVFQIQPFSVTGVSTDDKDADWKTPALVNYNQATDAAKNSLVTVSTYSWNDGNSQLLDLSLQRRDARPFASFGNILRVGKPGMTKPITLTLPANEKVNVRYFLYFTMPNSTKTGDITAPSNNWVDTKIEFKQSVPTFTVGIDPHTGAKVFFANNDATKQTYTNGQSLNWATFSNDDFLYLRNYDGNLHTFGLNRDVAAQVNGVHFDALVTFVQPK